MTEPQPRGLQFREPPIFERGAKGRNGASLPPLDVPDVDPAKHYGEISRTTGASTATITRIASWLHHGEGGYPRALERMKAGQPGGRPYPTAVER